MIKVMIIIDVLRVGGAERQALELIKRMDKDVFEVSVTVLSKEDIFLVQELKRSHIRYFLVGQRGAFDVSAVVELYRIVRQERPDIVTTYLFTADCYGRLAAVMAGIPVIISSQRNVDLWKTRAHMIADRIFDVWTDAYIVNANAVGRFLTEKERIAASKIVTIYNGVDTERYRPYPKREDILRELCIPEGSGVVGMIAEFSERKDHRMFLDAAKAVADDDPGVRFILAGDDGGTKDSVRSYASSLGIGPLVSFVPSTADGGCYDIPEVLALFDVSVLFSHYEGCANAILESMACEKPVVASDVGGNPEIVREYETGFLIPGRDVGKAKEKIMHLLHHAKDAQEMGRKGRKEIEGRFSLDTMVRSTQRLYSKLLNSKLLKRH